jgi:hypothetical protein
MHAHAVLGLPIAGTRFLFVVVPCHSDVRMLLESLLVEPFFSRASVDEHSFVSVGPRLEHPTRVSE